MSQVADDIALKRLDHALDNLAPTEPSIRFEIGRKHPVHTRRRPS